MTLHPVSISLSSYGADLVRERGQAAFIDLLADAGVSTIELREELGLPDDKTALALAIKARGLNCVYSSPLELWAADGTLQASALAAAQAHAHACGAQYLKVSLGFFPANQDLATLHTLLSDHPVRLLVENDQTPQGGQIERLAQFFSAARVAGVGVGMTFDIGNWQWQAQSLFDALARLGQYVEYVHCKGVQLNAAGKLVATPPTLRDLHLWEQVLQRVAPGVLRAIEFPLQDDDLALVTRTQIAALARLGQPHQSPLHEVSAHV
ncbi:AP endonuclease [Pseudomonas sp. MWU16-30317]|uniref:sugar phosphate isomerase/epimerase family protein n=1 Tax=Pseudomonas sp. MWU16-30317 TaxID=2878095 RepID=UPI001CFBEB93|nr:AP endonuclease [Pseudomonas sp. MWU16-30317]